MEEIFQTKQPEQPPPPPRPAVPVEVPNNELVEDQIIAIDAELNFDELLDIPAPPSEAVDKKEETEEDFFVVVEEMPELIGGIQSIQEKNKITMLPGRPELKAWLLFSLSLTSKAK